MNKLYLTTTNTPYKFPSIFSDRWLEKVVNETFFDNVFEQKSQKAYPYNVSTNKDETGNILEYEISVALAGVGKNNIRVYVENNHLYIDVNKKTEEENKQIERRGISTRKENFSFSLSDSIDIKNIKSKYEDGLLLVKIPVKKPEITDIEISVD